MGLDTDIVYIEDMPKNPLLPGADTSNWRIVVPPKYSRVNMGYNNDDYKDLSGKIMNYNLVFEDILRHFMRDLARSGSANSFYLTTITPSLRSYALCNYLGRPIFANECSINITSFDKRSHEGRTREFFTLESFLLQEENARFSMRVRFPYKENQKMHVFFNKIKSEVESANIALEKKDSKLFRKV